MTSLCCCGRRGIRAWLAPRASDGDERVRRGFLRSSAGRLVFGVGVCLGSCVAYRGVISCGCFGVVGAGEFLALPSHLAVVLV